MVQKPAVEKATRPRGRPRAYNPDEALKAARDVFWTRGYAGMNRPSLYAAFGDKEAIYLAALRQHGERLVASIEAGMARDLPVKKHLTWFLDACIDAYMRGPNGPQGCFLIGTALTESVARKDVGALVRDVFARCEALIEARLKRAIAQGELAASSDAKALAQLISATMHELAMLARTGEDRAALAARAGRAIKAAGL
jgi:TetR/AcrR family transcriptional regulator, copper-responsive repressor